jgi:hypothetical protein
MRLAENEICAVRNFEPDREQFHFMVLTRKNFLELESSESRRKRRTPIIRG